jgi:tRNA(Arg) A34 adenosine deaminase TadA
MATIRFAAGLGAEARLSEEDITFLRETFEESRAAFDAEERPCAALVVSPGGEVLARAWNMVNSTRDFSAHAETSALRDAARRDLDREPETQVQIGESADQRFPMALLGATLYASAEPCAMCSGAAFFAGISRIVFGIRSAKLYERAGRPGQQLWMKTGSVLGSGDRDVEVIGPVLEDEGLTAIGL